jgi:tRNA G18 (ribose-2'-O)-methylase SpoU
VSVSAAGIYSVIQSTAVGAFDNSGVNRAKSGATAQAIYINVAAASGSIAALSANAAIEIVYTRLDPSIYGV